MNVEIRFDLNDDELFEAALAASHELSDSYGGTVWIPQRENFVAFIKVDGQIAALAVWQEWEGEAFIGTAWTAPDFRRQGLYKYIVSAIRTEAAARGLKCVSACVNRNNQISMATHERLFGMQGVVKFELPIPTQLVP